MFKIINKSIYERMWNWWHVLFYSMKDQPARKVKWYYIFHVTHRVYIQVQLFNAMLITYMLGLFAAKLWKITLIYIIPII